MYTAGNDRPRIGKLKLVLLFLFAGTLAYAFGREYATFEIFYDPPLRVSAWGWAAIVASAFAAGALMFFTGGTTAGPIAAVGTWIGNAMGLSGAAATSAGLALLGGGSIAAGGLGMAGGSALLAVVFTFSTDIVVEYGVSKAVSTFERRAFLADSRGMTTLPLPRETKGPDAYELAMEKLEGIDAETALTSESNAAVLREALECLPLGPALGDSPEERCQNRGLRALLNFQLSNYGDAGTDAFEAVKLARELERRRTMPAFIYAVSGLYEENPDIETLQTDFFRYAVLAEPENRLIPLLYGVYLDRLMYLVHGDRASVSHLEHLLGTALEKSVRDPMPEVLAVIVGRILVEIKRTQQDIRITTESDDVQSLAESPRTIPVLRQRLATHRELVALLRGQCLGALKAVAGELPPETPIAPGEIESLSNEYSSHISELAQAIDSFEARITAKPAAQGQRTASAPVEDPQPTGLLLITGLAVLAVAGVFGYKRMQRSTESDTV